MELKQVVVNNGGMSQDLSVSKQENKLAFENRNIRIQATDDGTLLSVTNIKSPKTLKINLRNIFSTVLLGSCVTPEYLVLFAKGSRNPYASVPSSDESWEGWNDIIFRISLDSIETDTPDVRELYNGNLNFDISSYFDTLYYEEGKNVKKIYWTDNVNPPRVINIITPSERNGGEFEAYTSNVFDFYPVAFSLPDDDEILIPEINVTKNRTVTSELPAGVVQYFVSYYWLNGAETAIVGASDTFTVDFSNRGAKADEAGMCAFDIEIPADTVNHKFDYMRIYSAIRTTLNGPLVVKIVGDIKLNPDSLDTIYKITDTGIGQEQLDASHLFFIGGSPFVAKTLTEKDDTLFVGGIKTKEVEISSDLEDKIADTCRTNKYNGDESSTTEDDVKWWAKNGIIDFKLNKSIPNTPSQFNSFYPYKLQLDKGSSAYKTFKSGEIYRFGIQFQTAQGEWSTVVWIGDKECTERPVYDESTQCFKVNNAEFHMPNEIIEHVKAAGFVNYRIVIADPEKHNGRKIKMQGLLNPTMFTPGQRALDAPYALPSWIMRPRKGNAAYHHFEPLFSTEVDNAELASYTPDEKEEVKTEFQYPSDAYKDGYAAAWTDKAASNPYHTSSYTPVPGETEEQRLKNEGDWNRGYEIGWKDTTQETIITYDVTASYSKEKYTKPYIEEEDHDGKPGYVVTCFTVSPGNQLAIRSVKVWSDNANNNFYDADGNQPSKSDYKVLCDYAGSIGGAVYNNYGTIADYVPTQADLSRITGPTHDAILNNYYMWSDMGIWPYVYWDGKEWTYDPASVDPDYPDHWIPETICSPIYYGITEAFTREGIDLRLIPEPELFSAVAGNLVNSVVNSIFLSILYSIIALVTMVLVAAIGVATGGTFFAAIGATAAVLGASLALGVIVPTTAVLGTEVASEINNTKTLYSTDTIISQKNLRRLIGDSNYDRLPEFQRLLMGKRYFPLYSTEGNGQNVFFTRKIGDTVYYAGDAYWSDSFDRIVFSKTADVYYTNQTDYNNQENGLVTIPEIFRPHAGRRTSTWGDLWLETATYIQVFPISVGSTFNTEITKEYDNYYVDESYVTLNSPDAEDFHAGTETLKLRAIGTAPLTSNYTDASIKVNKSAATVEKGLDYNLLYKKHRTTDVARDGLLSLNSDYLYLDAGWYEKETDKWELSVGYPAAYKTYLFSPNNYLGIIDESELGDFVLGSLGDFPGTLTKQQILNHNFSNSSKYFETSCDYGDVHFGMVYDDNAIGVNTGTDLITYYPKYESAILKGDMSHHYMYLEDRPHNILSTDPTETVAPFGTKKAQGSVSITFNSSPHVFIDMKTSDNQALRQILPFFNKENDDYYRASYDQKRYVWEDSTDDETVITGHQTGSPTIPIPADKIKEIKNNLGVSDYHTQKGLWKQDSGEHASSYSIWDKGVVYHCGKYFIKDENNPWVEDLVMGNTYHEADYTRCVCNSAELCIDDPVFCSLIIAGLIAEYPNPTAGVRDYTIHLETLEEDPTVNIPNIIVGSRVTIPNLVFIPPVYYNYAAKLKMTSITVSAEYTSEGTSKGWKFVKSSDNNMVVQGVTLKVPNLNDDIVSNEDIYLNKLDETQPRFMFSLEDWTRDDPNTPHDRGYKYEETEVTPYEQYKDFRIRYEAPKINENAPTTPYLFIGELYQDIGHDVLYGGYNSHALRLLSWYPISKPMPIAEGSKIENTEGDTYYQRWDCLKTYPITEEDTNQVVDITSFMVETHKNLDARCDVNRATFSLMARPTNFNLFNTVYNQPNNIFEYATDWSELNSFNLPNEISWSLTKNLFGDVDTWTNITLENRTKTKYPVTKLLNWNNQVMALTEHSMEIVNFNAKNLVPSTDNSFIELQNSNRVDGTVRLQNPYGTHNMSTLITEQGLYFIEDNEKTLIRINGEGPKKIGVVKLIDWFHNNIVQGTHTFSTGKPFHLEYDNVHKDIYIKNEDTCLVYNELLDEFTSILTYSGDYWLLNYGGNIYAYRLAYEPLSNLPFIGMYKMFGDTSYNRDFGRYWYNSHSIPSDIFYDGEPLEYSVSYVINPNSYSDKVFTNGILAADLGVTGTDDNPMYPNSTKYTAKNKGDFPFNKIKVWNEYQDTGEVDFEKTLDRPSNLKQKFRIWRFIIPRDSKNNVWPRNRIRNPWARIKLFGNSTKKMEFHNMTIQYVE